jgi:antitoxin component of MazEF toxin-antitoxin module
MNKLFDKIKIWFYDKLLKKEKITLNQMLESVTDENRHKLIDLGVPVGKEVIED